MAKTFVLTKLDGAPVGRWQPAKKGGKIFSAARVKDGPWQLHWPDNVASKDVEPGSVVVCDESRMQFVEICATDEAFAKAGYKFS